MSASFDSGNERSQKETNVSSERRVLEGHTWPCEECAAVDWSLDTTRGEVTCNSCGLVVEENVPTQGASGHNETVAKIAPELEPNDLHPR